jgi:hypothetical protein
MENKRRLKQRSVLGNIIDITAHENQDSCFQNVKNIVQINTRNIPIYKSKSVINIDSEMKYQGFNKTEQSKINEYCKIGKNISTNKNNLFKYT